VNYKCESAKVRKCESYGARSWVSERAGSVSGSTRGWNTPSDHEYVLVIFPRDAYGRVSGFTVSTPRVQNLRFARGPG
jgi:hypothetical protein